MAAELDGSHLKSAGRHGAMRRPGNRQSGEPPAHGRRHIPMDVKTTAKYGLTPRLELRWGLPGRVFQGGSGTKHLAGTTDQWLGALYHFRDQGRSIPDVALDYGIKVPTGNPA